MTETNYTDSLTRLINTHAKAESLLQSQEQAARGSNLYTNVKNKQTKKNKNKKTKQKQKQKKTKQKSCLALSAGVVEYTDCISAEG